MKFILLVSKNIGKFVSFVPWILVVLINGINLDICWSLKVAMGKHIRPLRDIDTTSLSKILRQYEYMSHLSCIFNITLFLVKVKFNGHTWIIAISPFKYESSTSLLESTRGTHSPHQAELWLWYRSLCNLGSIRSNGLKIQDLKRL